METVKILKHKTRRRKPGRLSRGGTGKDLQRKGRSETETNFAVESGRPRRSRVLPTDSLPGWKSLGQGSDGSDGFEGSYAQRPPLNYAACCDVLFLGSTLGLGCLQDFCWLVGVSFAFTSQLCFRKRLKLEGSFTDHQPKQSHPVFSTLKEQRLQQKTSKNKTELSRTTYRPGSPPRDSKAS